MLKLAHAMSALCFKKSENLYVPADTTVAFFHIDIDIFTHAAILFGPRLADVCQWLLDTFPLQNKYELSTIDNVTLLQGDCIE